MRGKNFYLTTPIYYVNDRPHVGHAYTTVAADVLSRYHRLLNDDVFFLTGTDENAEKNLRGAEKAGLEIKDYLAQMASLYQETWRELSIEPDFFIRTTWENHRRGVYQFLARVQQRGDIYRRQYRGLYCRGCEAFKTEKDLVDGRCPDHQTIPEELSEENYFFRLTRYRDFLLHYLDRYPDFIQPPSRREEVRNFIANFMEDFSISRPYRGWGIPFPGDSSQVVYVWFDALLNYLTGIGYGWDEEKFKHYWPAELHLVGKDIIKFHCAYWPAMLESAGLPQPRRIFAHGYFTLEGQKISKSIGNVIDPRELVAEYGADALRYYYFRALSFGQDGDFSRSQLAQIYRSELAHEWGNLVGRVLALANKNNLTLPPWPRPRAVVLRYREYKKALDQLELSRALQLLRQEVRQLNIQIDQLKPWEKIGEDEGRQAVAQWLVKISELAILYQPFLPQSSTKIKQWYENKTSSSLSPLFPLR